MQGVVSPVQQASFPVMHVCDHEAVFALDCHEGGEPDTDLMQGATQGCTHLTLHQKYASKERVQE